MLAPLVPVTEELSEICDVVHTVDANSSPDLHMRIIFPEYLLFVARLRDLMHHHSIFWIACLCYGARYVGVLFTGTI
jgi:hypothetical protein